MKNNTSVLLCNHLKDHRTLFRNIYCSFLNWIFDSILFVHSGLTVISVALWCRAGLLPAHSPILPLSPALPSFSPILNKHTFLTSSATNHQAGQSRVSKLCESARHHPCGPCTQQALCPVCWHSWLKIVGSQSLLVYIICLESWEPMWWGYGEPSAMLLEWAWSSQPSSPCGEHRAALSPWVALWLPLPGTSTGARRECGLLLGAAPTLGLCQLAFLPRFPSWTLSVGVRDHGSRQHLPLRCMSCQSTAGPAELRCAIREELGHAGVECRIRCQEPKILLDS